jgi:hypothetical protein
MKAAKTPKFSGPHRRSGHPFGELSPLHAILSSITLIIAGLLSIALVVFAVIYMKHAR